MRLKRSAAVALAAAWAVTSAPARPADADAGQRTVINGSCQYGARVARHHEDTLLILCDTATIDRSAQGATFDFAQRDWGSMASFSGAMTGDKMAVSQITLRHRGAVAATGTCELFHRSDGSLAVVSCLGKAGVRWVAVNFVPSRL
ncbi:MAG TPA: hypothetical protein VF404_04635 [Sphingomonas sp.]